MELAPFPHGSDAGSSTTSAATTAQEEPPQGMLNIHKLPIFHERGGGGNSSMSDDWAFTLSRRKFAIKPFHLPPAEADNDAQQRDASGTKNKADLEF